MRMIRRAPLGYPIEFDVGSVHIATIWILTTSRVSTSLCATALSSIYSTKKPPSLVRLKRPMRQEEESINTIRHKKFMDKKVAIETEYQ